MEDRNTVRVLNDLIETAREGEHGFTTCAEGAGDPALKAHFEECAVRCRKAIFDLTQEVVRRGGSPETTSFAAGAAHQAWVNVKVAIASRNDLAVLGECERGEDAALRSYAQALDEDLAADLRLMIRSQYMGMKHNHDRIHALRNERRRLSA